MESLFIQNDWKRHMSVNLDSGLWQCFKTGRTGNFVRLYAEAEGIPYFRANRDLMIKNFEFLDQWAVPGNEYEREERQLELDTSKLIPLNIESGFSEDPRVLAAWSFLFDRRLFTEENPPEAEYYLCVEGRFANRIIIPFEQDGEVYFFQARALDPEQQPKYLNPSSEMAPKGSEVLYPYDEAADELVVCEGPLDAKSLQLQGINATSLLGSHVSPAQTEILSTFGGKIILALDNDEAGDRGVRAFDRYRKERRMDKFFVCPPPEGCKDWNEAHQKDVSLPDWIRQESSLFDFEFSLEAELRKL